MPATYTERLKNILNSNTIENEDLILKFIEQSKTDENKEKAITRFFMNSPSANPFKDGLSYYDLLHHYEDILNEE